MEKNLCQLEELKLHCMGCCGHDFKSRYEVEKAIKKNTASFHKAEDKRKWGRRSPGYVRPCGICYNIILDGYKAYCPLHPSKNQGKDLRDSDCELDYLCKTFKLFKMWDEKKQQRFLDFLKSKNLDWYEYSIGMDQNLLLEEFQKLEETSER